MTTNTKIIILSAICCGVLAASITHLSNSFESNNIKIKSYLGKSFVINNDTSTIIDYSFIEGNFTLSNGTKINFDLVEKQVK